MTQWKHRCKLEWMMARQNCLTASDVKDLLPVTRTGRKRIIDDESYLKVLSRKLIYLTKQDCVSVGAAARGHILEPYAIDVYNKTMDFDTATLYHWDDIVVTRHHHHRYGLAFSPDAVSSPLDGDVPDCIVANNGIKIIGEVKSYGPEHHMICGYTNKADLDERWQIATAMAVADTIEKALLLFYNPSMTDRLFVVDYDREDLDEEIKMVLEVEKNWLGWIENLDKLDRNFLIPNTRNTELDIIYEIMQREELNPNGEKSVIL